jgi:hypothetical protein
VEERLFHFSIYSRDVPRAQDQAKGATTKVVIFMQDGFRLLRFK